ncbi:MAG TPA: hypothetical protein VH393_16810 [Ktedonobacterales bacterium]|jgi:hypothetical protein
MATKLNQRAFEHAKQLIEKGRVVQDERDQWSEHQPSAQEENTFIEDQGFRAYAQWYLGVDDEKSEDTKERYTFPYGDFERVHRCGVLSAEVRAGQYKHHDIERATAQLRDMLDTAKSKKSR